MFKFNIGDKVRIKESTFISTITEQGLMDGQKWYYLENKDTPFKETWLQPIKKIKINYNEKN